MLRRLAVALACPLAALAAGCGNSRTQPPKHAAAAVPHGMHSLRLTAAGVSLSVPDDWSALAGQAPLVVTVGSGSALVALWRYVRSEPLPSSASALARARLGLIGAARSRDPQLQVIRSRVLRFDGARAIELDAFEHNAGQLRRVRSLHVFAFGAELVLDEYAPPQAFHAVDHQVFSPLRRSLRLFPAGAA